MKIKSIPQYQRHRGWRQKTDTSKHNNNTSNGKMNCEYWKLLKIQDPSTAIHEFLNKWSEVNQY